MFVGLKTITIIPEKTETRIMKISNELFHFFKKKSELTVSVGKKDVTVQIEADHTSESKMTIPNTVLQEFCLPIYPRKLQAAYDPENNLVRMGPVIGVLTDYDPIFEDQQPHFRSVHQYCEELSEVVYEYGGFLYVFSQQDFPQYGYYYHEGNWVSAKVPLPDVIYNRIHSRKLEYSGEFKKLRNQFEQLNIPFFNDRFLSKWEVHEYLMKEEHLKRFIPETSLFSDEGLADFTEKFETVFIKPVHGSQGKNIMKLEKSDECHYLYHATTIQKITPSIELYQQIKNLAGKRMSIIQQGIALLEHEGCPMDFRVLCHKNFHHQWVVTSLLARISAEQEFVSNIARGGKIFRPKAALQYHMNNHEVNEMISLIKELAIETAGALSKHTPGFTGELGIDIGIDKERKPWLIEVNFKPSKSFEDGLMKIRPSAKAIIRYCTRLAFDSPGNEEELK